MAVGCRRVAARVQSAAYVEQLIDAMAARMAIENRLASVR